MLHFLYKHINTCIVYGSPWLHMHTHTDGLGEEINYVLVAYGSTALNGMLQCELNNEVLQCAKAFSLWAIIIAINASKKNTRSYYTSASPEPIHSNRSKL